MNAIDEKKRKTVNTEQLPMKGEPEIPAPQSFGYMILSALALAVGMVFLCWSHSVPLLDALTNGTPETGELGYGRFLIFGTTVSFEYPFRLAHPTFWTRLVPWTLYFIHQAGQFWLLTKARQAKASGKLKWTPVGEWNPYSWKMFRWNVLFVIAHFVQSQLQYDGLAGSFSEISTLFAGVSSLLVAFMFEMRRRGVVFGWTPEFMKDEIFDFSAIVRRYHGYLALFGVTLTFWYHSMETTFSHLTGFFHIFLLLWQSSMLYQDTHRNRYWTGLLEAFILVHGSVVSYYQGKLDGVLYLMFLTSFTLLFSATTFWGLPVVERYASKNASNYRMVLVGILAVVLPFILQQFYSYQKLQWTLMCLALPFLYYGFTLWYYLHYRLGKWLDLLLCEFTGVVKRKSRVWWSLMTMIGTLSIWNIMFLAEFIYRLFVPYSSYPSGITSRITKTLFPVFMQQVAWKSWLSAYLAYGICILVARCTDMTSYLLMNWMGRVEFSAEWISMTSLTWAFNVIGFSLLWPRGINTGKRPVNIFCVAGMAVPHSLMDILMLTVATRLAHFILHTQTALGILNAYVWPAVVAFLIYSVITGPFYALFWDEQVIPIEYDVWKLVFIEVPSSLLFLVQLIIYNNILLVWIIALVNYCCMYSAMHFPSPWYRDSLLPIAEKKSPRCPKKEIEIR